MPHCVCTYEARHKLSTLATTLITKHTHYRTPCKQPKKKKNYIVNTQYHIEYTYNHLSSYACKRHQEHEFHRVRKENAIELAKKKTAVTRKIECRLM